MTQLLDLSALERDTVKLTDGTEVELRNPDELSVVDDYKLRKLITEFADLEPTSIESEEQADEASKKLHAAAAMIAVNLPEVDDATCAALFGAWIEKHIAQAANPPMPNRRSRRTTAASSRGSKRSTAATRSSGSRKSRAGR